MIKYFRFASVLIVCFYFWRYVITYTEWHFIDYVNLIFHEAGHAIFFFLGTFLTVLAGSAFQVILPFFIAMYFFFNTQKVSGAICLLWVGQNLLNVSVYAGDAIKMQLDLLGGDGVIHDWNYLLNASGMLRYTDTVACVIYIAGLVTIIIGTILSLYYLSIFNNRIVINE
jgi:hypothetical protein